MLMSGQFNGKVVPELTEQNNKVKEGLLKVFSSCCVYFYGFYGLENRT